jgi:hypothetical protein
MKGKAWVTTALLFAAALTPAALAAQTPSTASRPSATPGSTARAGAATSATQIPTRASSSAEPGASTENSAGSSSAECEGGACPPPPAHITIATPAPAPAAWGLQDRIKWATVVLLVLVAYVGIWLAISALHKIERQTRYAETTAQAAADAAKAALHYAEAHARAERPWILISAEPATGAPDTFSVVAVNRGRGPAKIVGLAHGIVSVKDEADLPADPAYKDDEAQAPPPSMVLLPGETVVIRTFRRDDVPGFSKTPEQQRRIENWEEKIYLYGKVTYVDMHSPDDQLAHETGWCCWYIHGRQKSGMVMAGPRKFNVHT